MEGVEKLDCEVTTGWIDVCVAIGLDRVKLEAVGDVEGTVEVVSEKNPASLMIPVVIGG